MKKTPFSSLIAVFVLTVLFTILFHKESVGINFFIFDVILVLFLLLSKRLVLRGWIPIVATIAVVLTASAVVLVHSNFAITMNVIAMILLAGAAVYPEVKSVVYAFGLSFINMLFAQQEFFMTFSRKKMGNNKLSRFFFKSRIFILPILIIFVFIFIYRKSNPVFDGIIEDFLTFIGDGIWNAIKDLDFSILLTLVLGLIIANFYVLKYVEKTIKELNDQSSDNLVRLRKKRASGFKLPDLKSEFKAGVFLLATLNVILLVVNIIDIKWVWFSFEWDGQFLKQFVHEGTYLLIASILISIFLVLFFFRGNLNFYEKNQILKFLSYGWLAQNAVLTISVAIRNFWYINYFNLAYKRIGVVIFLILTLYGLFSVMWKVKNKKSVFYLFKTNSLVIFMVLIISSLVNWDGVIARYNFHHSDQSFLHLDFMATLSDKTLPVLDKPLEKLQQIDAIQKEKFPFDQAYLTPEEYRTRIEERKAKFVLEWEEKGYFSWNLPEYFAYKTIKHH